MIKEIFLSFQGVVLFVLFFLTVCIMCMKNLGSFHDDLEFFMKNSTFYCPKFLDHLSHISWSPWTKYTCWTNHKNNYKIRSCI